jgi:hypothetical protein
MLKHVWSTLVAVLALSAPAAFCGPRSAAPLSYVRHELHELVVKADVIAIGTITRLESEVFELEVDEWVHGDGEATHLIVRRFRNWTCGSRPVEYEVGQRLFVFLLAPDGKRAGYRIMGGGAEGEMHLVEGRVAKASQVVRSQSVRRGKYGTKRHRRFCLKKGCLPCSDRSPGRFDEGSLSSAF